MLSHTKEHRIMNKIPVSNYTYEMKQDMMFDAYHKCDIGQKTSIFHAHESYEVYFYIRGRVRIVVEESIFTMTPGDMVIFPPDVMHHYLMDDDTVEYERMYFYAKRNFLKAMTMEQYNVAQLFENLAQRGMLHFHLSDELFEQCKQCIDKIITANNNPSPASELIRRGTITVLIATLCQELTQKQVGAQNEMPAEIDNLLKYVRLHFLDDIDTDELAAKFYMSKYHMMHKFKQITDMSLHQYILVKRIILAKAMLKEGGNANEVALKCGFSDYSCFYKAFKKNVGVSPREYVQGLSAPAAMTVNEEIYTTTLPLGAIPRPNDLPASP